MRKTPGLVAHVVAAAAEIRGVSPSQVVEETFRNYVEVFKLDPEQLKDEFEWRDVGVEGIDFVEDGMDILRGKQYHPLEVVPEKEKALQLSERLRKSLEQQQRMKEKFKSSAAAVRKEIEAASAAEKADMKRRLEAALAEKADLQKKLDSKSKDVKDHIDWIRTVEKEKTALEEELNRQKEGKELAILAADELTRQMQDMKAQFEKIKGFDDERKNYEDQLLSSEKTIQDLKLELEVTKEALEKKKDMLRRMVDE